MSDENASAIADLQKRVERIERVLTKLKSVRRDYSDWGKKSVWHRAVNPPPIVYKSVLNICDDATDSEVVDDGRSD